MTIILCVLLLRCAALRSAQAALFAALDGLLAHHPVLCIPNDLPLATLHSESESETLGCACACAMFWAGHCWARPGSANLYVSICSPQRQEERIIESTRVAVSAGRRQDRTGQDKPGQNSCFFFTVGPILELEPD